MNPTVDITSLRREATSQPATDAMQHPLAAPPRRVLTRYVIPTLLLASFGALALFSLRGSLASAAPVRITMPVLLETSSAQTQGAPLCQAPGWIEPDPFAVTISALTPGIVRSINALEGTIVSSGTVIAELNDEDARLRVTQAEAALARKRAEYQAAKANWDNPVSLKEAVQTALAEKAKLEAEKAGAQATLDITRKEAQIDRSLSQEGATGKFSAQKTASLARTAEEALRVTQAKLGVNGVTLEAAKERLRLRIEDRHKLATAEADVKDNEAVLEEARLRLRRCHVESLCSGTLMRLYATPGTLLSLDTENGMRIASIYDPAHLQVRVDIPMADAAKVRLGMDAEARLEAVPEQVFHGKVTRIVHEADVQRNTLQVKVRIADPDEALKPEMIARVQFLSPGVEKKATEPKSITATCVPASLAPEEATEAKLWVAGPDGRAHQRPVKLGTRRQGELREVQQGLWPSDKIIVSGAEGLSEGSRIRIAAGD